MLDIPPVVRSPNNPSTQARGPTTGQSIRTVSTSAPKCLKCGEPGHRMADCGMGTGMERVYSLILASS
jgi:hypothetical protein